MSKENNVRSRFNLSIIIANDTGTDKKELKLVARFLKSNSGYGNDTYLSIESSDGKGLDWCYDLRYDDFDIKQPETFLAKWAYNYWTGENGSYDIKSLKITHDDRV